MEGMTPEERFTKMENLLATVIENQAKHDAGIRDLIAVSRTVVDSQKQTTAQIDALTSDISELREAQKATEDTLHALIETVDRIIRQKN
jgi:ABC-type transporter Mla subunit MlaD